MQIRHSRFLLLAVCGLLLAMVLSIVGPIMAQATNLLQNPGFDGPYAPFNGDQSVMVAQNWSAWSVPKKDTDPGSFVTPEYRQAKNPNRTHSNSTAQEMFAAFGIFTGGVYQQVAVTPGTALQFSAFLNVWSSSEDDPDKSQNPSPVRLRVGIDPQGGTDGTSANVIWSGNDQYSSDPSLYDQFRQMTVNATSAGNTVTVFVEGSFQIPSGETLFAHNDIYIDDASLTTANAGGPTSAAPTEAATAAGASPTAGTEATLAGSPTQEVTTPVATVTAQAPEASPSEGSSTEAATTAGATQVDLTSAAESTNVAGTMGAFGAPTTGPASPTTEATTGATLPAATDTPGFAIPTREGTFQPADATNTAIALLSATPTQPGAFVTVTPFFATFTPTAGTGGVTTTGASATPIVLPNLPGRVIHVVVAGDTVLGLAIQYNSDVDSILAINNLDSTGLIFVGQTLVIPVPVTPTPTFVAPTLVSGSAATATQQAVAASATAPVDVIPLTGPTVNGIGTYIVQPGDTFQKIANRYNMSVQALAALNGIVNPDTVTIGQVLVVPGPGNNYPGGTIAPTVQPTAQVTATPQRQTHVVQVGENLFRIALKYNVSLQALMQANGISNPNLIYVGQVLVIP